MRAMTVMMGVVAATSGLRMATGMRVVGTSLRRRFGVVHGHQVHMADRTLSRTVPVNLGMHRTGVGDARGAAFWRLIRVVMAARRRRRT